MAGLKAFAKPARIVAGAAAAPDVAPSARGVLKLLDAGS